MCTFFNKEMAEYVIGELKVPNSLTMTFVSGGLWCTLHYNGSLTKIDTTDYRANEVCIFPTYPFESTEKTPFFSTRPIVKP